MREGAQNLQNLIELNDGIICYRQAGDQTRETIFKSVVMIRLLTEDLPDVKILVDYSDSGKIDLGARQAGFYAIKSIHFDKVAIFGASPAMVKLVGWMARMVGKSDTVHFTETRQEALRWLQGKPASPVRSRRPKAEPSKS